MACRGCVVGSMWPDNGSVRGQITMQGGNMTIVGLIEELGKLDAAMYAYNRDLKVTGHNRESIARSLVEARKLFISTEQHLDDIKGKLK